MKRLQQDDIQHLEKRYRAALINALSGFKSINLVGTVSTTGLPNLAIVSSVVHLGSDPALMGFVMRPVTVTRDTYHNIMDTGYYTFNHITADFYKKAHQTAARYPATISEFREVGLTPEFADDFKAPFVRESPVKIGMQFREKMDIKLNGTVLMIGEIVDLYLPEDCLADDGHLDIEKAGSIAASGLDSYHTTQKMARLSYAKPGKVAEELD